jgi:hypothetical protein
MNIIIFYILVVLTSTVIFNIKGELFILKPAYDIVNSCTIAPPNGNTSSSCQGSYSVTISGCSGNFSCPPDEQPPFTCDLNKHYKYLHVDLQGEESGVGISECTLNMSFNLTFLNELSYITSAVLSVPHYNSDCSCNLGIYLRSSNGSNLVGCDCGVLDTGYYNFELSVTELEQLHNLSIQNNSDDYGVVKLFMNPSRIEQNLDCTTLIPTEESIKLFIVLEPLIPFMICEGDYATSPIICPIGKTVQLISAQYGRFNLSECINSVATDVLCAGADVTTKMQQSCSGNSCIWEEPFNVLAGNDPCPDIYKQLEGNYICE